MKFYILDDYYPNTGSSFRIAEFNWYLRHYQECQVFSTKRDFLDSHEEFAREYSDLSERARHAIDLVDSPDFYYCVFINNAFEYLSVFEKDVTPFSFTLYPGGGLHLDEREADEHLARVGESSLLQDVIVTQKTTLDYVTKKGFFPEDRVHFVFGGALDSEFFRQHYVPKRKYGSDKDTFDICFIAYRYDPRGIAKGYDVFLEVARELMGFHEDIRFHLVGGAWWDVVDEMDTSFLGDRVIDHGFLKTPAFPAFHAGMDMIVSPNRPFCHPQFPGAFDGFPTGCCVEAGMCGTPVLCTDLLGDNVAFEDKSEIRIIPYDVDGICDIVTSYFEDLNSLYALGDGCREAFLRVFDIETQMSARCEVLGLSPMG